ncbi:MAG TPA: dienelactone hydrolase family protein [Thermomicrobiales bacterium]|nr:dienelactone hydrolase family protein [Thermomicrobiales bacterium]
MTSILDTHPHAHQPVLRAGVPIEEANGVVILLHGRGSPAANIIRLANDLAPDPATEQRIAYLAPQAIHNTWYPYRFIEPVERNEPYLSSALMRIDELVSEAVNLGLHSRQVLLVGFSQGACLGLEYVARGTSQVAGVAGIAGGLIGDPAVPRPALPDLEGTKVFIGCGDQDDHIDIDLAERSARLMADAGADVDFRRYPGVSHTMLADEAAAARDLVLGLPMIGPSHP